MSLPTPEQMDQLSAIIVEEGKKTFHQWYTYKGVLAILERSKGAIATQAIQTGAGAGVSAAAGSAATAVTAATTVATVGGIAIGAVGFGVIVGPWIAVAEIARQSGTIFSLYDLKEAAVAKASASGQKSKIKYICACGKCAAAIQYIIDKKERNVGRMAIAPFTGGLSVIVNTARSISKMFDKGRPKELNCKHLIGAARAGCTVAIATIFLLAGNWEFLRGGNAGTMRRAISMIASEDGWMTLREAF